jgi:selenocysteine lyase/cysteine desulfurase
MRGLKSWDSTIIYLNYAALSPTRPEAQREVEATLAEFQSLLFSEAGLRWYQKKISACRQDVAGLLNFSEPSSIAFVPNASMASHLAFSFVDWGPGDVILTSTHENPSVREEIDWLVHRGVKISKIKPTSPHDVLTTIETQMSIQQIRAIILSHVSHIDGRIFPITEIGRMAHEHDILFIVDGAQAVGHIPVKLDQLDFDLYFFPGHKWCRGPLGTGALIMQESFVAKNAAFAQAGLGWNNTRAGRFEIGTHNMGLIAGLAKACTLLSKEGLRNTEQEKIRETAREQLERIDQIRIQRWAGQHAPGILTFQCRDPKNHKTIMDLFQNGEDIVVKQFLDYPEDETPAIRLSWSGAKEKEDVLLALKVIKKRLKAP